MTEELNILVVDDHPSNEEIFKKRIQSALDETGTAAKVFRLERQRLKELIDVIGRVSPSESPEDLMGWFNALAELRKYDVLFLDYQLRDLDEHAWLTAEDLAGIIRAFGGIRQVIILNRFHELDFDLGMAGWGGTAADLHLNDRFLYNIGLWRLPNPADQESNQKRFRPWHWPLLPRVVADTESCISELEGLDLRETRVLGHLKMDGEPAAALTRTALGSLNPISKTPAETTFAEFLRHGCKGVGEHIRRFLAENLDDTACKIAAARIITSELRRWLALMVLGPQDLLIDPPHLAQRMPWLLAGPVENLDSWNATVQSEGPHGLKDDLVAKCRFNEREHWFSRTVFWVRALQSDDAIDAAFEDFSSDEESDSAFQEDFSRFVAVDDCAEFTAAFNSIWANRFVSSTAMDGEDIVYAPKARLV